MLRIWEKALVAVVLLLVLGALVWTVALADSPAPPANSALPVKDQVYTYTVSGGAEQNATANATHLYYTLAEFRYSLHDTRLESCQVCHSVNNNYIDGLNLYGQGLAGALGATAIYGNGRIDFTNEITITDAMIAIEGTDSDNDTHKYTNKFEFWQLGFPGGIVTNGTTVSDTFELVPSSDFGSGGVHGGYGDTPDGCARCHRAHTAQAPILLKEAQAVLCISCHDGSGALTNVEDGIVSTTYDVANPNAGEPLRGGGFVNALMNTDLTAADPTLSVQATSAHTYDDTPGTMWGWVGTGSSPAGRTAFGLECGNCHDPHNPTYEYDAAGPAYTQYRMIKGSPRDAGLARYFYLASPSDDLSVPRDYVQTYRADWRPDTMYQTNDRIGEFCAACHTQYMAGTLNRQATGKTPNPTSDIFEYRHATKESTCSTCHNSDSTNTPWENHEHSNFSRPRCLECHVAHGTTAQMGSFSGGVAFPDGNFAAADNDRSSLLRLDNRGVCYSCHEK